MVESAKKDFEDLITFCDSLLLDLGTTLFHQHIQESQSREGQGDQAVRKADRQLLTTFETAVNIYGAVDELITSIKSRMATEYTAFIPSSQSRATSPVCQDNFPSTTVVLCMASQTDSASVTDKGSQTDSTSVPKTKKVSKISKLCKRIRRIFRCR